MKVQIIYKNIRNNFILKNKVYRVHQLLPGFFFFFYCDGLFYTGFTGFDNNRAVCDFGIKEFNHELVLQSVKEVNVPHSWPIFGEYMGDLYT